MGAAGRRSRALTGQVAITLPATRSILLTSLPAAVAIGVFGVLYGAAARPLVGEVAAIASSVFIFSGALQFALVGLLAAGATAPALLATALTLNLRHIVLGAVLRPRMGPSVLRRGALAWLMVDETFGFAVASGADPSLTAAERTAITERTLLVSGIACYGAWQAGTVLGVLGAGVADLEGVAGAIFPVLFIGLAALSTSSVRIAVRAAAAAVLTAAVFVLAPDLRALAPVIAGVIVALPGGDGRRPAPARGGEEPERRRDGGPRDDGA